MIKELWIETNIPCIVCDKHNNNRIEPVHGTSVCQEHTDWPPSQIKVFKDLLTSGFKI